MKLCKLKGLLYLCCLCMVSVMASAKDVTGNNHVDTLSFAERLTFRTNMVDWTLLVPNIGVEFDIFNENWNRWTVGLNFRGNWQTSHTFKQGIVYNISGVRAEFRNYWRTRQINEQFPRHTRKIDKLFSCRRNRVKHPGLVYYRGAYLSYNEFSLKLSSKGYQGQAYTLGFTYGVVKPLYVFKSGSSLDFELGFSAGFSYARPHEYTHNRESDCYPITKISKSKLVFPPTVSDIRVGFAYRVGKYPITKKYRWRYEVDEVYREHQQQIADSLERVRRDKEMLDGYTNSARETFWHVYDSVYSVKKHERDSINAVNARLQKEVKEKEHQAKLEAKAAEKKAKAATNGEALVDSTDNMSIPSDSIIAVEPVSSESESASEDAISPDVEFGNPDSTDTPPTPDEAQKSQEATATTQDTNDEQQRKEGADEK